MKNTKKLGRIIGFLMLGIMSVGVPSTLFRGISTALTEKPDFLTTVFDKSQEMRLTILFDMLASALWLVVGSIMLQYIKTYSKSMAYIFFGLLIVFFLPLRFLEILAIYPYCRWRRNIHFPRPWIMASIHYWVLLKSKIMCGPIFWP